MKELWHNISFLGFDQVTNEEAIFKYRENILINRICLVMFIVLILYTPIEIIFNGWKLVWFIYAEGSLLLVPLLLNYKKKYEAAKYMVLGLCLFMISPMMLLVPKGAGNELYMIPASTVGVLLFRSKLKAFYFLILSMILFYIFLEMREHVDHYMKLTPEKLAFFYPIFVGMVFIFSFIIVIYFRIANEDYEQIINKQRDQLQQSNDIIYEKNKEIIDSINYAKRIQEAIMPSLPSMHEALKNEFVLYKPKDIVAGDFFWMEKVGDVVYYAAADCTGHGVPGAMVSVVCSNALTKALLEEEVYEVGRLLDRTRELVINQLAKSGEEVKDGMDISLCRLEFKSSKIEKLEGSNFKPDKPSNFKMAELQWAGANNGLWIIRSGTADIEEIKPDKQPIGKYAEPKPFTSHTLQLNEGDTIYVFTDGYQDQFGGVKGKKFKASQLKQLLLDNQSKSMKEQRDILASSFESWKSDLEQVDDVCIIGVQV